MNATNHNTKGETMNATTTENTAGLTAEGFKDYTAYVKGLDVAQLTYTIRDLSEVITIQEDSRRDGYATPKLGVYWDQLHTCVYERNLRQAGR